MRYGNKNMKKEEIIDFEQLYESMMKCKRGVMWKISPSHYVLNGLEETLKLEEELKSGVYKTRKPKPIKITHPKPRDGLCISFRDRVYQRSLNDNALYPKITNTFIYDNIACQKGKGTDLARERAKEFLRKFYRKHGRNGFIGQIDIHGYFSNMQHEIVKEKFKKHLDYDVYKMAEEVLDSQYAGEVGFNPGSQMVQIAGISMLDELDHYIKEKLKIKFYIRYMDDFLLIHEDEGYLKYCMKIIEDELRYIGLEINTKKTKVTSLTEKFLFLGFYYKLTETGKVIMTINPQNVKHERRKLRKLAKKVKKGEVTKEKVDSWYEGWKRYVSGSSKRKRKSKRVSKRNNYKMLKRMDEFYKDLWRKPNECKEDENNNQGSARNGKLESSSGEAKGGN